MHERAIAARLLEAGIARGRPGDARPVQLGLPVRHAGEKTIANQAGERHRGSQFPGRFEHQADVLEPQA